MMSKNKSLRERILHETFKRKGNRKFKSRNSMRSRKNQVEKP